MVECDEEVRTMAREQGRTTAERGMGRGRGTGQRRESAPVAPRAAEVVRAPGGVAPRVATGLRAGMARDNPDA